MATQRGGRRIGPDGKCLQGRKPKPQNPEDAARLAISQQLAREILEFAALPENPHAPAIQVPDEPKDPGKPAKGAHKCRCILCRWRNILESTDVRVRLMAEDRLMNRAYGRAPRAPIAPEDKKGKVDPLNSNMRVIVEFIGSEISDSEPA